MASLNPGRLMMARTVEHLSQRQLSELIERTQHAQIPAAKISRIENGLVECSATDLNKIAAALDYPIEFFNMISEDLNPLDLTYRRTAKTRISEVNAIVGEYQMLDAAVNKVTNKLGMAHRPSWIDALAPRRSGPLDTLDIDRIAQRAREQLRLESKGAVPNMTRALERSGILVVPMRSMGESSEYKQTSEGVTAPALKKGSPIIGYIRRQVTGDRMRFTKAHELGHLVLHAHHRELTKKQMEDEAHTFAGAILMPREDAESTISETTMLSEFVAIKAGWGISISALVMRASALGLISADRKRSLQMQISARGWRKMEPVTVDVEHPLLFKQMLGKAYGRIDSPTEVTVDSFDAVKDLGVPFRYLDFWTDGLKAESEQVGVYERRFPDDGDTQMMVMPNDCPTPQDVSMK